MLIVIVTLRSLPQSFEQVVLTEFPPTSNGAKYIKKQKLLQDIQDPPLTTSGCQRKTADFHIPVWSMTQFCYDYLMSRFVLRTLVHVKLYFGLFHPRRSEELSAVTIGVCRYASVRVTNSNKCDTECGDKKCNESNKSLQTKTSTNSYLGRHPPSAYGNNEKCRCTVERRSITEQQEISI